MNLQVVYVYVPTFWGSLYSSEVSVKFPLIVLRNGLGIRVNCWGFRV